MTERDEARSVAGATAGSGSPIEVLVVAGDADTADATATAIERHGSRVTATTDPTEAFRALDRDSFDCVVSEYHLRDGHGIDLLESVRDRYADLPFVLFAEEESATVASEAVSAGVDEYVPKGGFSDPFDALVSRIDDAVSRARTERQLTAHLDRMTDAFCRIDGDWRLAYLNDRATELLDRDADDLLGRRIWECFPGLDGTALEAELRSVMETGEPTTFEYHADLLDADLEIDLYPSATGLSAYFRDVTPRKAHERELEELSERLQLALEGADVGVWDWDLRTDKVEYDDRWAEMLGYEPSEITPDLAEWKARVHPDDIDPVRAAHEAHLDGDTEHYQFDHRLRSKDGDWLWIRDRGRVVKRDDDGEPLRAVGIHIDVTEEKERERALERYRRLIDELPEGVCEYDAEGRFALVNGHIASVYGMSPKELTGRPSPLVDRIREMSDGDPFAELVAGDRERLSGTVELDLPDRPGTIVDFELQRLLIDGEFDGVLGISRDVTDERRRQRRLERTSARLGALYEGSPDMIDIHDEEGQIVDANRAMLSELGYDHEALTELAVWDLDEQMEPSEAVDTWEGLETGETVRIETTFRRADGTSLPVEVHVRRIDVQEESRFLASSRDISERKAYERRIERENERLDEFASIVSHDLRNPLNVLSGYLHLAMETGNDDYYERCERALDEMERLIEDVLTLARQGNAIDDVGTVDLREVVTSYAEDEFGPIDVPDRSNDGDAATDDARSGEDASTREPDAEAVTIDVAVETDQTLFADAGRLKRLLGNLLRNAAEHGGSRVVVGDLPDGFYVEDDGPGIPEDRRDAVFESGYSTTGTGTGFGLAIVQSIAEAHGWDVTLSASESGGARFEFTGVDGP
ncbi:hybrid sensor histidine kinase/response regulator [Halorubrum laminariae]|uniref:histidine kinase n=1 Tax=Halorubrum laminariae TaxID=1433523 RepID=A0ABD6C4A4_9EURY|nr:PAS domain S-box protein [Halorubrum laminariae]